MIPGTKTWRLLPPDNRADELMRISGISPIQALLLANRGITRVRSAREFLHPRLETMADPMEMADMERAVSALVSAIANQRKITVYGDYDADGLTSTALLVHFLSRFPVSLSWYIPNRLTEGYGLSEPAISRIAEDGTALLITVDCGSSNASEVEFAKRLGLEVVVTDHHRVSADSLPSCPFVNPNRPDCPFPFKNLAGVGVAFYLLVALRSVLRSKGFFKKIEEPDLRDYLDLVALGTVADAVPLTGENRTFVQYGLGRMRQSKWWGMEALKTVCGCGNNPMSSEDAAFKLAPRLNAAGRIGDSISGIKLLLAREPLETTPWIRALESANKKRKIEEQRILAKAEKTVASITPGKRTLFMAAKNWHRGVIGIAASRLVEKFNRPTALLSIAGNVAYGSARSVPGFDLHDALRRLAHLLNGFGGHAMAAGFSLETDSIKTVEETFEALAAEIMESSPPPPELRIDAEMELSRIDDHFITDLTGLAPYGEGNPEPRFIARRLRVISPKVVGRDHLKMDVADGTDVKEAIGFGMGVERPPEGGLMDIVFTPEINSWQGTSRIQLRIADMRPSNR
jgi:single-stranded-DNA-specific exonuclease